MNRISVIFLVFVVVLIVLALTVLDDGHREIVFNCSQQELGPFGIFKDCKGPGGNLYEIAVIRMERNQ